MAPAQVQPPEAAVLALLRARRGTAHELRPAFGEDPVALEDAVPEVEQPEAHPVGGAAVLVAAQDEVAPRVGLQHEVAGADPVEEHPLRMGEVFLVVVLDGLPDDPAEGQRVRVPVAELGARRDAVGLSRGVLEDVQRVETNPHVLVLGNQRGRPGESEIRHVEPAAHGEQVPHQDDAARVALFPPFGHRRRIVEPEVPLLHEHADQRRGDAHALGPTDPQPSSQAMSSQRKSGQIVK